MKTLSVLVLVLAVGLTGCGEDMMGKDDAMKLVTTAMEKAGGLKDLLGKITNVESAMKMKDQLAALVPAFLSSKKAVDAIPAPVQKLVGGKMEDVHQLFSAVKGQAGKLLENGDIKSKIGDLLGKLTG